MYTVRHTARALVYTAVDVSTHSPLNSALYLIFWSGFPIAIRQGGPRIMHSIAWWPTLFAVTVATVTDLRARRIPNWLVFPFLATGVVASTVSRGLVGLESSILGVLLGSAALGLFYFLGAMG